MQEVKQNNAVTVYVGTRSEDVPALFFLDRIISGKTGETDENLWNMFQGESGEARFDFMHIVSDPSRADFLLLPHNYFLLRKLKGNDANGCVSNLVALARKHEKKILVFGMADSDEHIDIPHSVIFRYSQYGYRKRENEIIMPPYPLHFRPPELAGYRKRVWKNLFLREKREMPVVSFCGWAGFPSIYRSVTYRARILFADIKAHVWRDKHAELHKQGIYFRRAAIRALEHSPFVKTNFLIRKSYSAQKGFDGMNRIQPKDAEKEYIESVCNSDFVLAPKGNGNASVRFYEALSLGRFPVLVNTDCLLPLKECIEYDKFVVIVDHTKIFDIGCAVRRFYDSLSNEEFQKRQKMAREAFLLLRPGSFLKIALTQLKRGN